MKYYYEPPEKWKTGGWKTYKCNHPLYNRCTLYTGEDNNWNEIGIAVVQMRFNDASKAFWWGSIDPRIAYDICQQETFGEFFYENAAEPDENGLYPTFTIRQIMWALRMKPLRKEYWELDIFHKSQEE